MNASRPKAPYSGGCLCGAARYEERGELREYRVSLPDGRIKTGKACPACTSRLWGEPVRAPQIAIVQPGTLDDASWVRPVAHIWTRSAMAGTAFAPGAVKFEANAGSFEELMRLWRERNL
jgi:hypothetical protein